MTVRVVLTNDMVVKGKKVEALTAPSKATVPHLRFLLGINLSYFIGAMSWAYPAITVCLAISVLGRRS